MKFIIQGTENANMIKDAYDSPICIQINEKFYAESSDGVEFEYYVTPYELFGAEAYYDEPPSFDRLSKNIALAYENIKNRLSDRIQKTEEKKEKNFELLESEKIMAELIKELDEINNSIALFTLSMNLFEAFDDTYQNYNLENDELPELRYWKIEEAVDIMTGAVLKTVSNPFTEDYFVLDENGEVIDENIDRPFDEDIYWIIHSPSTWEQKLDQWTNRTN